jgi:hypothetical protein
VPVPPDPPLPSVARGSRPPEDPDGPPDPEAPTGRVGRTGRQDSPGPGPGPGPDPDPDPDPGPGGDPVPVLAWRGGGPGISRVARPGGAAPSSGDEDPLWWLRVATCPGATRWPVGSPVHPLGKGWWAPAVRAWVGAVAGRVVLVAGVVLAVVVLGWGRERRTGRSNRCP